MYGLNPFDYSAAIADEIRHNTTRADKVLIIGSEPQILFYARRRSATRYIFFSPLAAPPYPGLQHELDATLKEIELDKPKYVVDATRIATSLLASPKTNTQFFRSLDAFLGAHGYQPTSFYMPLPVAARDFTGKTFAIVDPYIVLDGERQHQGRISGVIVLRRPE